MTADLRDRIEKGLDSAEAVLGGLRRRGVEQAGGENLRELAEELGRCRVALLQEPSRGGEGGEFQLR